ncbi:MULTISPECIES: hypothetical protein [Protofrankia]|uniref:Uncharacterized protein n=1 Tax=Protofrankia coriariae TaxID=1562887 RepID=A0ABR5EZY0_9ACTN|nr:MULTISPECIES: hypothetical protein [Protofrankia]KLL10016.1 hypothetical protein FrCorBMG51_20695 [Protofrankia coriariae]ONH33432.1 hypothetical protein BL254_19935 [Protofrankia sp. BMG5.30]
MTSPQGEGAYADPILDGLGRLDQDVAQILGQVQNALLVAQQITVWVAERRRRQIDQVQTTGRVDAGRSPHRAGGDDAGETARRRAVAEDAVRTVLAGDPARAEIVINSEGFGTVVHRLPQVCRTLGLTSVETVGRAVFMFSQPRGLGDVSTANAAAVLHDRLGWLVDSSGIPGRLAGYRVDPLVPAGTGRDRSQRSQPTSTQRSPRDPDPGQVRATTYPGPPRPGARSPGGKGAQAQPAAAPVRRALPTTVSRGR